MEAPVCFTSRCHTHLGGPAAAAVGSHLQLGSDIDMHVIMENKKKLWGRYRTHPSIFIIHVMRERYVERERERGLDLN